MIRHRFSCNYLGVFKVIVLEIMVWTVRPQRLKRQKAWLNIKPKNALVKMIARNPTIKLPIILNEHTVIEDSDQSSERFGYTLAEPT